ncbi:MAG: hypothetical protein KAW09_08740 [Thermoplasmata archaeon]|nr:hypothetical protein [Thermoplasmata archaeon]
MLEGEMHWTKRGTILFALGVLVYLLGIAVMLSVWHTNDDCEFVSYRSENPEECMSAALLCGIGFAGLVLGLVILIVGMIAFGIGKTRDTLAVPSCPRCGMVIRNRLHVGDCPKCGSPVPRFTKEDMEWRE